eukprot:7472965-Alexandrium_andersonii.AAC.1
MSREASGECSADAHACPADPVPAARAPRIAAVSKEVSKRYVSAATRSRCPAACSSRPASSE